MVPIEVGTRTFSPLTFPASPLLTAATMKMWKRRSRVTRADIPPMAPWIWPQILAVNLGLKLNKRTPMPIDSARSNKMALLLASVFGGVFIEVFVRGLSNLEERSLKSSRGGTVVTRKIDVFQ